MLEGQEDPKLEIELPFAAMIITLMASSGITPYRSFKRLKKVKVLEKFSVESEEIVRLVEVLGNDPLTAMKKRAEETRSRVYSEFLNGYVSSVKSGGSTVNYLTSKLKVLFDVYAAKAKNAIERLETLVEAYMVMLIVIFCFYIILTVTTPSTIMISGVGGIPNLSVLIYPIVTVVIPVFSLFFMYVANNIRRGTLHNIRNQYLMGLIIGVLFTLFFTVTYLFPKISFIKNLLNMPTFVTLGLVCTCIPSAFSYHLIAKRNFSAESAMPGFIRDLTEARRTGISPEKSIVHAASRKGYGYFSMDLNRIVNQIEWGVSLRKIFNDLREWIKSWPVLVNFFILVETIEIGGGDSRTLELLAEYSEKTESIEKSQRDMLKPYIILPFVWTILMAFTVTFTVNTLTKMPLLTLSTISISTLSQTILNRDILNSSIIFHSWLSGFFIGKVSEGSFVSGFKFAAILAFVASMTLYVSSSIVATFMGVLG